MINQRKIRKKIKELQDEVAFIKAACLLAEREHEKEMNDLMMQSVKDIGYWKIQYDALDKEKDQWSEDARRLQDRIDTHEQLQYNEKFLGLVRAVKYINDFKIPVDA